MVEQRKKRESTFQNSKSTFFEYKHSYLSYDFPTHQHNYLEMEIVLDGSGTHIHNGVSHPVKRGDVYILRTTDRHGYKLTSRVEVINISFSEKMISADLLLNLNTIHGNVFASLSEKEFTDFLRLCKLCEEEYFNKNKNEKIIENLVNCICIYILRHCEEKARRSATSTIDTVLKYLHNHFHDDITLYKISESLGYTPDYLSRLFKKETGMGYNEYLNNLRIQYAKHLLSTTDMSIVNVSSISGFRSYNHFYINFLKNTGITPSEYKGSTTDNISQSNYSIKVISTRSFLETVNDDTCYANIHISPLKANTEYEFSYSHSRAYSLILECIYSPSKNMVDYFTDPPENIIPESQTHIQKTKIYFKTNQGGEYIVRLKKIDSDIKSSNIRLAVPDNVAIKELNQSLI